MPDRGLQLPIPAAGSDNNSISYVELSARSTEEFCNDETRKTGSEDSLLFYWKTRSYVSAVFTFFATLSSMAYVYLNEQKILPEFSISIVCISVAAAVSGYCFGRRASLGLRPVVEIAEPDDRIRASPSLKDLTAEAKLKKLKAEGVMDESGWFDEYIVEEDDGTRVALAREANKDGCRTSVLTFGHTDSLEVVRDAFDISQEVKSLLGEIEWNLVAAHYAKLDDVKGRPILGMSLYMMQHHRLVDSIPGWLLNPSVPKQDFSKRLQEFFYQIDEKYEANPYHNSTHAVDVMKMVKCLFFQCDMVQRLWASREWTWFISVVAAAIHDMGHTGQTNNYHIAVRSELALRYNDKSPLEQMHVASAFQVMAEKGRADWFSALLKEVTIPDRAKTLRFQDRVRKTLISMVLATDNLQHNALVDKMKKMMSNKDVTATVEQKYETQLVILETILHAADISHPTYQLDLHVYWSGKLMEEFWAQGDLEKEVLGDASMPMFDRDKMNVPGSQIGFFKFIALGLWEPLAELLPEVTCRLHQMKENLEFWEKCKAANELGMPTDHDVKSFAPSKRASMYLPPL